MDVTVYEKESKGGGLMTYGIAAYKVTPSFCEEEVDFITSLGGIDVKYNHALGKEIMLEGLQKDYDAVYLGIGVGLANKLNISGEELEGVVDAISFIYNIRTKSYANVPVGDKVVVIGMGMTAIDAATQAKRLGANKVTIVYRRSEKEKNAHRLSWILLCWMVVKYSGLQHQKRYYDNDGKITALVCNVMKLGAPDYLGKPMPEPTGETLTFECDMIINATGQSPYAKIIEESKIENSKFKIVTKDAATNIVVFLPEAMR